jgi:hypothetical protein
MRDGEYNGWENYETWRINLEILDGMTPEDFGITANDIEMDGIDAVTENLAEALEGYVAELLEADAKGFALDLALSFIDRVNWGEIAHSMLTDYIDS